MLVVAGAARLEIEGRPSPLVLEPGDWAHLPARCRHRVAWTSPDTSTVWLAVHGAIEPEDGAAAVRRSPAAADPGSPAPGEPGR